jgi:hypothetical protein
MLFFAAKMRLKIRWFALKTARAWCSGLRKSGKNTGGSNEQAGFNNSRFRN